MSYIVYSISAVKYLFLTKLIISFPLIKNKCSGFIYSPPLGGLFCLKKVKIYHKITCFKTSNFMIYRKGGEQVEYLLTTIAVLTSIVTIRKFWHEGTKSKLEANKIRLENRRKRRGG